MKGHGKLMNNIEYFEIEPLDEFANSLSNLVKKKRFHTLPSQIRDLNNDLKKGVFPGDLISVSSEPKAYKVYKLRLPNPDANVGKSNGYRIYYLVVTESRLVVILTIYYKKEIEAVSDIYIKGLIDGYFLDTTPFDDDGGLI